MDHLDPVGSSLISAEAAARALQERFLANADRGDNAANDELVAELVRRIRALQAARRMAADVDNSRPHPARE